MKRKRVLLTAALLVAATLVTTPLLPEAWQALAYEQRVLPGTDWAHYLKKKASWLPGSDSALVATRPCPPCRGGEHEPCSQITIFGASLQVLPDRHDELILTLKNGDSVALPVGAPLCTCADPRHRLSP